MSELMIKYRGGKMVADESELLNAMLELLAKKSERNEMGKRAKEFVEQNQGALARVMEILAPYIEMSKVQAVNSTTKREDPINTRNYESS